MLRKILAWCLTWGWVLALLGALLVIVALIVGTLVVEIGRQTNNTQKPVTIEEKGGSDW